MIYNKITASGGKERKYNIAPTEALDGVNTLFTLPENFDRNTLIVKVNGIDQGPDDFTASIVNDNQFELVIPPESVDTLLTDYTLL